MTHRLYRPIALTLAALALAGVAAGCSAEQKKTARQLCQEHPAECADLVKDLTPVANGPSGAAAQPPSQPQVQVQAVPSAQVPAGLREWGNAQQGAAAPASKVIVQSDASYIGVAAGQRPSGGYTIKLSDLRREGDGWVADAQVTPPAPGQMVTEALTNPVAYFKLPVVDGPIQVRFGAPSSTTPPLPPAPTPGNIIPRNQVWSQNFRATRPRLLSDGKLFLEGTARAFEAVFQVQVWSGSKLLLTQSVQTAAGAPEFGRFTVTLTVPGGVPAGAEVRYQIPSMKDGSVTTELTLPVTE